MEKKRKREREREGEKEKEGRRIGYAWRGVNIKRKFYLYF